MNLNPSAQRIYDETMKEADRVECMVLKDIAERHDKMASTSHRSVMSKYHKQHGICADRFSEAIVRLIYAKQIIPVYAPGSHMFDVIDAMNLTRAAYERINHPMPIWKDEGHDA